MGKSVFSRKTHRIIQFASLALIAIGMPSTKILMSMGLVFAVANWILEGQFREKWQAIRSSRLLQVVLLFYFLLIIGVAWSWDVPEGIGDLKSRLPMLLLPLVLATGPLMEEKDIRRLLQLFLASLFVTSVYNILYFNNIIGNYSADDIRGLSRFASHIRYGLIISLGAGICIWFQLKEKRFSMVYSLLAAWFVYYTVYSQVLSGVIALMLAGITIVFFLLYHWRKTAALGFAGIILAGIGWVLFNLLNLSHEEVDCSQLPEFTEQGYRYTHNCQAFSEINGKAILTYYSELEMYMEWGKVSEMDFMGQDKKGELLRMTAARYMTAIGLTKDAKGVAQLTKEDVKNIEDGYSYPNEKNELIMPRIYGIKYQLLNRQFPNGHSLLQRLEHWKASLFIIREHWLIGVGTGGNQKAFDWAYEEMDSPLTPDNRKRSHNMFLTYTVSYGVFGLLLFLTLLGVAFRAAWNDRNLLSLLFMVVICGSFLNEDTLETQLGVTIFGFFMALLAHSCQLRIQKQTDDKD